MTQPGVLMVTGAYYPELSGAGLQCRQVVQSLQDRVTFTVLTTTATDTCLPEMVDEGPICRIPVDVTRLSSKARASWRMTVAFLRLSPRFTIVHLHGFSHKTLLLVLLAKLLGKRIVLKLTSVGHDDPASIRARGIVGYWCYRAADLYVGVSARQEELYRHSGLPIAKFRLIPNGVDLERFRPGNAEERGKLRQELGLPPDIPLILFVGFFSQEKHPDVLFDAWKRLRDLSASSVGLVFIGATRSSYYEIDQELVQRIREEAKQSGYGHHVVFVETTKEIEKYYRAVDLFVLSSSREGLPNALLEAMASGLACIASTLRGVTDWIIGHRKNGLLVPINDVGALQDALNSLLENRDWAGELGGQARRTIEERFSLQRTAASHFDVYSHLCA